MTKFSLKEAYEPVRLSREEKDALLETILARSSGETPAGKEGTSMRRNPKHPLLIAAVISGLLCLVGCAAVYVLTMEDFKVGQREVTQEVWDENRTPRPTRRQKSGTSSRKATIPTMPSIMPIRTIPWNFLPSMTRTICTPRR